MRRAGTPAPSCPDLLQGAARDEWDRVAPDLHSRGLLREVDRGPLVVYCLAWARMADAEAKLRGHGLVIISPSGFPVPSPFVSIATKAEEQLLAAAAHFGMTPSTRTGVPAEDVDPVAPWRG